MEFVSQIVIRITVSNAKTKLIQIVILLVIQHLLLLKMTRANGSVGQIVLYWIVKSVWLFQ